MRRNIFLLTTVTIGVWISASLSQAQTRTLVGLNVGTLFSSPKVSSGGQNISQITTFFAGGVLEYHLNQTFGLKGEIDYARKGYNTLALDRYQESLRADFIQIPLLAKLSTSFSQFGLSVEGGPWIAFKLSEEYTPNPLVYHTAVAKDYYPSYDIGVALGSGVSYTLTGGISAVLGVRYSYGFNTQNSSALQTLNSSEVSLTFGFLVSI